MLVRLCFENKNTLSFIYTKEKNTAIDLNSDFFQLILMVHCLFTLQIDITFWRFKENLA